VELSMSYYGMWKTSISLGEWRKIHGV
jgi:hypothetical protein